MFVIEFSYECEIIENRYFDYVPIIPKEGERIRLEFTNDSYNSYGFWWIILEVHHFFSPANLIPGPNQNEINHIVRLYIEKDPKNGLAKNDPLYTDFLRDD